MNEQQQNLNRVEKKISQHILDYFKGKVDFVFHMQDLQDYVAQYARVAPDSPRRILRELKNKGKVDIELLSRSESRYLFKGFDGVKSEQNLLESLGYKDYGEYIKSPWWTEFKRGWLTRHERKCSVTGRRYGLMDFHHITYERLGNENDEDVILVCREVHDMIHRLIKVYGIPLAKAHLALIETESLFAEMMCK